MFGLKSLFGTKEKDAVGTTTLPDSGRGGWFRVFTEGQTGDWQKGVTISRDSVLTSNYVYPCMRLISSDVAKLGIKFVRKEDDGRFTEIYWKKYSELLKKPNRYQNIIQFTKCWMLSKLSAGNTYALKRRNNEGAVVELFVLDPFKVKVLVAPGARVFYQLGNDNLSPLSEESMVVPASEIIHDMMNPIHHPLIGISPIVACGLAATHSMEIQNSGSQFFRRSAAPSGILTSPDEISKEVATRLKDEWENNFQGQNMGRVAVAGSGLKFERLALPSRDAQLIEQLKFTAEMVCTAFGVPHFKLGVGSAPTYQNALTQNQVYYSDCLQSLIEEFELALGQGIDVPNRHCVMVNIKALLRMDVSAQMDHLVAGVGGKVMTPNDARAQLNMPPVPGGDHIFGQQQDIPLGLLEGLHSTPPADKDDKAAYLKKALEVLSEGLAYE